MTHDNDEPDGLDPNAEDEDDCQILTEVISRLTALTAKNFNNLRTSTLSEAGELEMFENISKLDVAGASAGDPGSGDRCMTRRLAALREGALQSFRQLLFLLTLFSVHYLD